MIFKHNKSQRHSNSFIHGTQIVISAYYVPDTILSAQNIIEKHKCPNHSGPYILVEGDIKKKNTKYDK